MQNEINNINTINDAAAEKFGIVLHIINKDPQKNGREYFVACKRDNCPFPEAPYMYITAIVENFGGVVFHWGHYDLTLDQVHDSVGDVMRNAA